MLKVYKCKHVMAEMPKAILSIDNGEEKTSDTENRMSYPWL